VLKNHAEERIRVTELSVKYDLSINNMEKNIREKLLIELSDEKTRFVNNPPLSVIFCFRIFMYLSVFIIRIFCIYNVLELYSEIQATASSVP
jgi:hypothetical protein